MTTICIDKDGMMAADGKASLDGVITDLDVKKIKIVNGWAYAVSGVGCLLQQLIEWHRAGCHQDGLPKNLSGGHNWTFIAARVGHIEVYSSDCPHADIYAAPWAWGTGRFIALGAMAAGKTAQEAVEIACQYDVWSGGEIQCLPLPAAPAARREAAE